jgi:hypothetical protein
VRLKEESEVKWGGLLGVVALTTNQPYFSSAIATGELQLTRLAAMSSRRSVPTAVHFSRALSSAVLGCY